jgi:lipopolysaccharide-induced tumor necrosis factor-alpha factor
MNANYCQQCGQKLDAGSSGAGLCPACGRSTQAPPPAAGLLNGPCPFCGTDAPPAMVRESLSTNGWVVFAVLLLVCIPICWLPFVIDACKMAEWKCPKCLQKRA